MCKDETSTTTGIEPEGGYEGGFRNGEPAPDAPDAEGHGLRFGKATDDPAIEPEDVIKFSQATDDPGIEPESSYKGRGV